MHVLVHDRVLPTTSSFNWRTRIGSFKFPQCNVAPGTLQGKVTDSTNGSNISGALVQISGGPSTSTNLNGDYSMSLAPGTCQRDVLEGRLHEPDAQRRQVTSGALTSDNASLVPSPPPPQPPTGLAANPGNSQVGLIWNASSGATGYNVFRGTLQGGGKTKLNPSPVSGTSYNDTAVSNGTTTTTK